MIIEPGGSVSVRFTVATKTNGTSAETLTLKSTTDRNYTLSSPAWVVVAAASGGAANGTVDMTVPVTATSGTDVTLTIEAQNGAATDINYTVLRFLVSAKVTNPPLQQSCGITLPLLLFSRCFCVSR